MIEEDVENGLGHGLRHRRCPDEGPVTATPRCLPALRLHPTRPELLDRRLDPVLPLSPGRLERHGFEYYRHGTLSLYAALNTRNGEVVGKTAARHTSQEFVAFLADLVANQPRGQEISTATRFRGSREPSQQTFFSTSTPVLPYLLSNNIGLRPPAGFTLQRWRVYFPCADGCESVGAENLVPG
jgi:hypothetical protein